MPVPTLVTDLSTTVASNSPAGSDNVFPDLDNYLRALSGFVASIRDNSGNGWVSPYLPLAGGTVTGATIFSSTVALNGALSGTGLTTYLASPPAIGGTTPAAGSFTTLSASGNVTLSGGTANGVLYLNGSKVATSGSALTFDGSDMGVGGAVESGIKLKVFGAVKVQSAQPIYYMNSDNTNNVQIANAGATGGSNGQMAFTLGGVGEQMRLTSTGLGIGTSSPGANLQIGNATAGSQVLAMANAGSSASTIDFRCNGAAFSNGWLQYDGATGVMRFATTGSERMRLDGSGNLGIGTTSPAYKLDVNGVARLQQGFQILDTDGYFASAVKTVGSPGNYGLYYSGTNAAVQVWAASSMVASFNASGNVGIGTSSPGYRLTAAGASTAGSVTALAIENPSTNAASEVRQEWRAGGTSWSYITTSYNSNSPYMAFGVSAASSAPTERMRLDSAGNLGIGTSSPTQKLDVSGAIKATGQSAAASANSAVMDYVAGTTTRLISYGPNTTTPGAIQFVGLSSNASAGDIRATIDASGNLGLGVTPSAWSASATAIEQKNGVAWYSFGAASNSNFVTNAFVNSAVNFIYKTTDFASRYQQISGQHLWYTAPSGTAGNAISFTQAMTLDASGNLQVGTTASAGRLTVNNTATGYAVNTRFYNDSTNTAGYCAVLFSQAASGAATGIIGTGGSTAGNVAFQNTFVVGTQTSHALVLATNDTERARITSGGNFGVNTTNPTTTIYAEGTISARSGTTGVQIYGTGGSGEINSVGANPLIFLTNSSERARITSGGALLVGTTTESGSSTANGLVCSGTTPGYVISRRTSGAAQTHIAFVNGGTTVGDITSSTTATTYATSSDYRLKDNPQPLTNSGAFIDALQPKTWEWKVDGSRGVGFIAHEAQAVSPSSVVGTKDAVDEEGKPVMQAMEYGSAEFIANIIAELQSLRARVAALESN